MLSSSVPQSGSCVAERAGETDDRACRHRRRWCAGSSLATSDARCQTSRRSSKDVAVEVRVAVRAAIRDAPALSVEPGDGVDVSRVGLREYASLSLGVVQDRSYGPVAYGAGAFAVATAATSGVRRSRRTGRRGGGRLRGSLPSSPCRARRCPPACGGRCRRRRCRGSASCAGPCSRRPG